MATSTNTVALAPHPTFRHGGRWLSTLARFSIYLTVTLRVCSFAIGLYHWQNVVLLLVCMDKLITKHVAVWVLCSSDPWTIYTAQM